MRRVSLVPLLPRSLLLLVAATGVGCTLLNSLSGFTGGEDVVVADAAKPGDAGGARDGGGDASTDAVTTVDAGRFCEQRDATFCEDWDDAVPGTRWSIPPDLNASHGFTTDAASSPPRSLWATTQPLGAGGEASSRRIITFAPLVTEVTVAVDVLIQARGAGNGLVIVEVDWQAADGFKYAIEIALGSVVDDIEESKVGPTANYNSHQFSKPIPNGTWTRVTASVTRLAGGAWHLSAQLAGETVLDTSLPLFSGSPGGHPTLSVGAVYLQSVSPASAVNLDNITFDAR